MANMNQAATIKLNDLRFGILGLTKVVGSSYAEAASVCLDDQGHSSPKPMDIIKPEGKETVTINWDTLPARAKGSWDLVDATEWGACGIAALIVCKPRGLAMERAKTGSGIDFWLGSGPLMQRSARLEVSGILSGPERIRERGKQKLNQTQKSAGELPVTVVIVEFSRPESWIADHER